MGIMILAGLCMVVTAIILMARINLKRFLGYPNLVDVAFTLFIMYEFAGTFSGAAAAAIAGIFMSTALWALRCSIGCERLATRRGRFGMPQFYWRVIPRSEVQPPLFAKIVKGMFTAPVEQPATQGA